jgi:tagaturonate reductase
VETNKAIKVIQFGEGNFLRAFVDWMIQKMNDQNIFNGQVAIVQPLENGLINLLEAQNLTYTHYLKGMKDGVAVKEHYKNTTVGMTNNPYEDYAGFLALAHIETANIIVSNTTEAGIDFSADDKFEDEARVTYPGKLTKLLLERYNLVSGDKDKGYIILPCELIDDNAVHLKAAILKYVELWDLGEGFGTWVNEANTFCNTLVDRIVPGYPRDTIEEIWEELGYKDQLVVESEQFNLWVIEGDAKVQKAFPADEVGCNAIFVKDVKPYKMRKVRILNGAHTALVPVSYLYGLETVGESIEDPLMSKFLIGALFEEIIPTLTLSQEELETFAAEVIERFRNPFIKHRLMSISLNSMSKYETRVLPSLLAYLDKTKSLPKRLVLSLASYIVFYRGSYNGKTIDVNDSPDITDLYRDLWSGYDGGRESIETLVTGVLSYDVVWKGDLSLIPGLTKMVSDYVERILSEGMKPIIEEVI